MAESYKNNGKEKKWKNRVGEKVHRKKKKKKNKEVKNSKGSFKYSSSH